MSKLMDSLFSGVHGNGGEHHHHPDGHGNEGDSEELAALIKSFGVAVLGKVGGILEMETSFLENRQIL